jgi:hypothetical protein
MEPRSCDDRLKPPPLRGQFSRAVDTTTLATQTLLVAAVKLSQPASLLKSQLNHSGFGAHHLDWEGGSHAEAVRGNPLVL